MATITVTHVGTAARYVSDLYKTMQPGDVVTTTRASTDLPAMASLQAGIAEGDLTLSVVYDANELAAGLEAPPNSVHGEDMAEVAAATAMSGLVHLFVDLPVGGGGADVITVYALDALPFKMRVLDAVLLTSTAAVGTITVEDEAVAGVGTTALTLDSNTTPRDVPSEDVTTVLTPAATTGLFVHRTDSTHVGELMLTLRRES